MPVPTATPFPVSATRDKATTTVRGFLNGKKLATFNESIRVWNESRELGNWIKHGLRKANKAFYAGLLTRAQLSKLSGWRSGTRQEMCVSFGYSYIGTFDNLYGIEEVKGLTLDVLNAWAFLCTLKEQEFEALNEARPKPIITPIGASPRVTATLKECNLDVDLQTIKPAEIEAFKIQAIDHRGALVFDEGKPVMVTRYRVKWSPGIQLNASRFDGPQHCQLCGKLIRSGRFVAMEMTDRHNGVARPIGMWVGRDCAQTLLGVDDVGIERPST